MYEEGEEEEEEEELNAGVTNERLHIFCFWLKIFSSFWPRCAVETRCNRKAEGGVETRSEVYYMTGYTLYRCESREVTVLLYYCYTFPS